MIRRILALGLLLSVCTVPVARAQNTAWVGLAGGASIPMGDFADVAKNAFDLGLTYAYPLGETILVGVDLYNHQWQGDGLVPRPDGVAGQVGVDSYRVSQVSGLVYWVPVSGPVLTPYLRVGPGYYQFRTTYETEFAPDTRDHFGFLGGGGVLFGLTDDFGITADVVWHHVARNGEQVRLNAVSATAGLVFRFGL